MRFTASLALAAALSVAGLVACSGPGPIVGGPCSYETSIIEATVKEVDADRALFTGPDGEFYVSQEYLREMPAVGDTLTLKRELITEGTCTPEIYSVVAPGTE